MLLFSTILEINKKLTKDDFINLVIEWNQKGHPESVISGIKWNGERNIRFEDENKSLEIQEYRNKNIIAVRFEKREANGAVWDTDYIMNFSEMRMAVRLDRSYIEEALNIDTKFFTPFFISLLIDRGYILQDGDFEVPFDVADGRIQLVFPEFFVQLRIDLVLLFRGQVAYAQQVPQPADPLFLFGFENMFVLDYVVQIFREGLRLVLPARR